MRILLAASRSSAFLATFVASIYASSVDSRSLSLSLSSSHPHSIVADAVIGSVYASSERGFHRSSLAGSSRNNPSMEDSPSTSDVSCAVSQS